jgi:site-specific recombinase XerD
MSPERQKFLERLELKGFAPTTRANYEHALDKLARFHNRSPLAMTTDDIETFLLHELKVEKFAPATVNLHIGAIKTFYRVLAPESTIMRGIGPVKVVGRLPVVLTKSEIKKMIDYTKNIKHRAILEIMYCSGLRLDECLQLKPVDIRRNEMLIHVRKGKGGKVRYTLLAESALETLTQYYRQYRPKEFLFEGPQRGKPLAHRTIGKIVEQAAARAHLDKRVTPHTLRHTFATHLLEQNVNLRSIQKLLGHSSIKTTTIYTHVSNVVIRNIVNPLDALRRGSRKPKGGRHG